ncbi:MAG: DegT/DnrJ/EryC1/StrS family aminotransferase [Labilithrix sp.]|nr:DegT/DnrJ/EryC1/StrS family aminotransferase [Labilithrix sp.]MBX3222225.1 DegT/DnrJ/EryC1/StrS family aminotransferase [Labilithrix sp.]
MPVPFIDLTRIVARVRDDVLPAWTECLDRCEFVGGPRVGALEKKLAGVLGVPRVVSCANGTDALLIGLQALGVKAGSKVALPNLTFWATFEAIVQLGATPVLVDVDPDDLQVSLDELRSAHDAHRFDAAILVHLFGWTSARLGEIRAFCKERGVALLEDGAQCFGVEVGGEPVLAKADVATLSFYPAKVVGGAMDGGAITLQTEAAEARVRSLCNHGRSDHYAYAHVGWNSRMGGVQAAFILRVLDELPAILASRREAAEYYRARLTGENKRVKVYGPPAGVLENGYLNVVTVEGKKGAELADALKKAGIGAARTYPETMDVQPPVKQTGAIAHGDLAVSKRFCESVVNLPLFYGIRDDEREASATALLAAI